MGNEAGRELEALILSRSLESIRNWSCPISPLRPGWLSIWNTVPGSMIFT